MAITITLSWWLLPLLITIIAYACATYFDEPEPGSDWLGGISSMLNYGAATIVALLAWLIYFAAT